MLAPEPKQRPGQLQPGQLTARWTAMREHAEQMRLITSVARYNTVPAGRRSGKTELIGKRKLVIKALNSHRRDLPQFYRPYPDPRMFAAAPTRDQVKRIYWTDLKRLIPPRYLLCKPNESQLMLSIANGCQIWLLGMDKPERAEGVPWDYGVLDEIGNMKKQTWPEHIRASLSDRQGSCDFIGVPEGRNHYYDLHREALARAAWARAKRLPPEWDSFTWFSADILPPEEIAAARRDLDELTFKQEYEASFINFSGQAYWAFNEKIHCHRLHWIKRAPICFNFDFNTEPGTATVLQEQWLPNTGTGSKVYGDGVIGEVHIPRGSNTPMVCEKLVEDFGEHEGPIYCYGDFTGGSLTSSSVLGSDWQLIKQKLWKHFGNNRVYFRLKPNPRERDRVNSVNSRLLTMDGEIRMVVDPTKAPWTVKDFEGTRLVEGGAGRIDKLSDTTLSHLTDGVGYRTWYEYPVKKEYAPSTGTQYYK